MPSSLKRGAGDASDDDGSASKAARTDGYHDHAGDFSGAAKKKSSNSSRTGQACDRCKIRKIRCDARPGGCSPCLQNNTECKTTDRITGRATSRGHTEQIENENAQMKMYMVELQQQLREHGAEPKPPPAQPYGYMPAALYTGQPQSWEPQQDSPTQSRHERQHSLGSLLPDFRTGCIGDNYLGVSSENNWLSPIEGMSLALFGTKIDLAEFMPPETDPVASAMSYRTFLNHAFGRAQPFAPALPAYEQCKVYSEWYFRSIQQFIPVLHKPDFMALLDRVHHENYQPTSAETVMIHMVLAVINFQFSSRNSNDQARQDSMSHYHYALSFIPDLMIGHKLEDIQALTLICSQLRSQSRPGAAWMFTNTVMGIAIESGLHRSAKAWQGTGVNQDPHHLEMRKRTFWTLLVFHVYISGKLGRPMPLRMEDFDIEMPEAVNDNLPGESNISKSKKCSFRAGIEGFKLLLIMMKVYSTIYSIRSTGQYETNVRTLQNELEEFQAQLPAEFRGGPQTKDEDRVSALYIEMSVASSQLLLHHPSLCRSASPQLMSGNLDVCLHWSGKLLSCAVQLKALKSLDTTWYYSTDFLAAIFTTLFAFTERRDQITSADLQRLKQDMDQWLDVMGEVGTLMGSGLRLQSAVRGIVDFAIGNISRHLAAKTASAAVASTTSPDQAHAQQIYDANGNGYYANGSSNGDSNVAHSQGYTEQAQAPYPSGNQFAYPDPQGNGLTYSAGQMGGFDNSSYSESETKPNIEAQLAHAAMGQQQSAPANFMAAFQSPNTQVTNGFQQSPQTATMNGQPGAYPQAGPAAWRHFADSMMTNVSGQEYMSSAGALMALSGGKPADGSAQGHMHVDMAAVGHMTMPLQDASNQPWPLIHYTGGGDGQ